jgi:hypothetical protein
MAALFSPESERIRSERKGGAAPSSNPHVAASKLREGAKSGDSLGNPYSPGYEGPATAAKKQSENLDTEARNEQNTNNYSVPGAKHTKIRLQAGWEKLLFAQKKLCEKAREIFVSLDAPERYRKKTNGRLQEKSRGSIVDLDIEELRQEEAEKKKSDKDAA